MNVGAGGLAKTTASCLGKQPGARSRCSIELPKCLLLVNIQGAKVAKLRFRIG